MTEDGKAFRTITNGNAEIGSDDAADSHEMEGFLPSSANKKKPNYEKSGCLYNKHTKNCFIASGVFGGVFILLGIILLISGEAYLEAKIEKSMALTPGSDRFQSWLTPPVQPHLTAYAFHLKNPEAVLNGRKPVLEEIGPFVYKSQTVKDSDDNLDWHDDDRKLTYRPRKFYSFVPELSKIKDPWNTYITVPNIPLWTGLNKARKSSGAARGIALDVVSNIGLGTPFINVSLAGLLWGYNDELPCLKLDLPGECHDGDSPFSSFGEDDFGDDDFDFKRRKRAAKKPKSPLDLLSKPKAEFVDCKCKWGLFRDRNVTMRKPIEFMTGVGDLSRKGRVISYDGSQKLGFWQKDSVCDRVRGQDSSTLPPNIRKEMTLDIFIALMCRPISLEYELENSHAGIRTYRFIPPPNAMGAHDDPDLSRNNSANECYCMKNEGFDCYKSGVYNMEPCKRDTGAPLALSYPHFYQADQSFLDAVDGLKPEKEKHQFFMDVVPEFGFPLAIRPRFQLNVVIGDAAFWDVTAGMGDKKTVLPFLWAQDGFDEPSEEMANAISFGLGAPKKLSMLGAVVCFVLGGVLILASIGYFFWMRKSQQDLVQPK